MSETPSLLQRMQADAASAAEASLDDVRRVVRAARDVELAIDDLEVRLAAKKEELQVLKEQKLVEIFTQARTRLIELEAEGNLPAYTATLKPFYKANISAEWEDERRERGFNWMRENGHGDLIKWAYTVELGRGEEETAEKLRAALEGLGLDYTEKLGINHQTLTAWFKDAVEQKLPLPELEVIGAQRGQYVDVKPVKEKKSRKREQS